MQNFNVFILACCILVASAAPSRENYARDAVDELERETGISSGKLSQKGKLILRKAALRMLADLCLDENAEPTIMENICRPALGGVKKDSGPNVRTRACLECPIADPVCFASCPE